MKWSVAVLVGLGIVAALAAAMLVAGLQVGSKASGNSKESGEARMIVAATSLPALSAIDADSVAVKTIPAKDAPEGRIAYETAIIGKVLAVPMKAGQMFTKTCFVGEGSGPSLAAILPEGKRAVSLSMNDHAGLAGLLYPGCIVDVIVSFKPSGQDANTPAVSRVLLQGVQVLAVDTRTVLSEDSDKADKADKNDKGVNHRIMVTLLVTPDQAQKLQASGESGTISLAMRNPLDVSRGVEPLAQSPRGNGQSTTTPASGAEAVQISANPPSRIRTSSPVQVPVEVIRGAVRTTEVFQQPEDGTK